MTFEEWWNRDAYNLLYNAAKPGIVQKWQARAIWREAVAEERERCAKTVEEWPGVMQYEEGRYCADIDEVAHGIREIE